MNEQNEIIKSNNRKKNKKTIRNGLQKEVDIRKALKLRLFNNLSYEEIGIQLGHKKQTIYTSLKPFMRFLKNPEAVEAYQENKAKILNTVEFELLKQLTDPKKVKSASLNNVAYAFKNVSDQGHLARGEATANINMHKVIETIEEADQEIQRLEKELLGD